MRRGLTIVPAFLLLGLSVLGGDQVTQLKEPSLSDDRFGSRIAPIFLLTRPDIQTDLRLDAGQISAARLESAQLWQRAAGLRGRPRADVLAARQAIDEEMTQWLIGHLAAAQLERLRQIDLQWEGASAMLTRPVVGEYMKLSPDQRRAIALYLRERDQRRAHGALVPEEEVLLVRKAFAVLSEDQKAQWNRLLGAPCKFSVKSRLASLPRDRSVSDVSRPGFAGR
jgi:hypothetical protein